MAAVLKVHLGMIGSTVKKPRKESKAVKRYYPRLRKVKGRVN